MSAEVFARAEAVMYLEQTPERPNKRRRREPPAESHEHALIQHAAEIEPAERVAEPAAAGPSTDEPVAVAVAAAVDAEEGALPEAVPASVAAPGRGEAQVASGMRLFVQPALSSVFVAGQGSISFYASKLAFEARCSRTRKLHLNPDQQGSIPCRIGNSGR